MHRTRVILAQSSRSGLGRASKKFLLPTETFWSVAYASLAGLWSHLSDQTARDEYEKLVSDKVIKDTVLAQARHGSMLTMALFHNLRSPLFAKHNFDAVEFVEGVAPALETFQDTLGRLVREMNKSAAEPGDDPTNTGKDGEALSVFSHLVAGENIWRKQAKDDPDSLAARLAKMVTDGNFDDHFYGAKLFQALTAGAGSTMEYVAGSGVVGQVALLNARVMEIDATRPYDEDYPELAASSDESKDPPVAARMDVLYEFTQTYQQAPDPLSASKQYKSIDTATTATPGSEPGTTADGGAKESGESASAEEEKKTISETTLAVAVLEGWLHGGPNKDLRWRVAMVRDAFEFS